MRRFKCHCPCPCPAHVLSDQNCIADTAGGHSAVKPSALSDSQLQHLARRLPRTHPPLPEAAVLDSTRSKGVTKSRLAQDRAPCNEQTKRTYSPSCLVAHVPMNPSSSHRGLTKLLCCASAAIHTEIPSLCKGYPQTYIGGHFH